MGNFPFNTTYNASAFDGTIESDFMALGFLSEDEKKNLIDYSVADFDEYKAAFITYLKAVSLDKYNNFAESDLGMFWIDLIAYKGATLSLKADYLANEKYLPTVQTTEHLMDILELIGIQMKGPIASKCSATLTPTGFSVTGADTVSIAKADRTITLASKRDGKPLSYTLYKTNLATGLIDQSSAGNIEALSLDATYYNDTTDIIEGLVLLEGVYHNTTGVFSTIQNQKVVNLGSPSIIEGSIFVSASDGYIYSEIINMALAKSGTERVFEKRYNADYSVSLFFGDGVRGANPQPGVSYSVFYRTGGGDRGDIVANTLNVVIPVVKNGVDSFSVQLFNSTQATGGSNAETVAHAKRYAPYFFRTQYRAVTGDDYNAMSNSFVSTAGQAAKAIPALRQSGAGGNMLDIYVLAKASDTQVERASLAFKGELLAHLNQYRCWSDEITIVDGVARTLDLVCTIYVDKAKEPYIEDIKTKSAAKILEFFHVDNREFGESFNISELTNHVLRLPEVRFFSIDNVSSDIFVNFNELIQLNNFEINVELV